MRLARAFRSVASSTNALELFISILGPVQEGPPFTVNTVESKLYALCGIRKLKPEMLEAYLKALGPHFYYSHATTSGACHL